MKHRNTTGISQSELHELMEYHEDGYLVWKVQRGSGAHPGKKVGTPAANGRLQASVLGERIMVANIVWCWHTGIWPQNVNAYVDHINRDPGDNRYPANLRLVSHAENMKNTSNSVGPDVAKVKLDGFEIILGRFQPESARFVEIGALRVLEILRSSGRLP